MKEIYNAKDIDRAQLAVKAFEIDYGAKYPKEVAKITDDLDVLLEFFKYPAEHWIHLHTTNPIEWTFASGHFEPRSPRFRFTSSGNRHGLQAHRDRPGAPARSTNPNWSRSSAPAPCSTMASCSYTPADTTPQSTTDTTAAGTEVVWNLQIHRV